jgi:RsiW-degrading membrane proteinase PrsW (M82 family)
MFFIFIIFILIVVGLVWYLLSRDRGSREPVGALWAAAGFGVLGIAIAIFLETKLLPLDSAIDSKNLGFVLVSFLAVGIIEEVAKFGPLAAFIYKKPYFNEHTDGIIYFAISGITFGLFENIGYTLGFGAKVGLTRIILVPFFHAATTGMVGYYLAKAKVEHRPWQMCLLPLLALALLHGVYDFGLTSNIGVFQVLSLVLTLLFSVGLFLYYMRANELDKAVGLSAVGSNKFCRACGKPNPNHTLYCEICGKPA